MRRISKSNPSETNWSGIILLKDAGRSTQLKFEVTCHWLVVYTIHLFLYTTDWITDSRRRNPLNQRITYGNQPDSTKGKITKKLYVITC